MTGEHSFLVFACFYLSLHMRYLFLSILILTIASCSRKEVVLNTKLNSSPEVVNIYPTSEILPENLLRFYVEFSNSMRIVNNLENIKLLDEKGKEIKGAIFNNVYELWDSEQKQLTLILDPARVKTGLKANENFGRALQANKKYQLIIEKAEDIYGNPLDQPYVKEFFVKEEDMKIPDFNNWKLTLPKSNSFQAFKIQSPQAIDRLSLLNKIVLVNSKKEIIDGEIEISNQEKEWSFSPKHKWEKGTYMLIINSRLEDPCGNNLNGLFDHKIGSLKNEEEGKLNEIKIEIE